MDIMKNNTRAMLAAGGAYSIFGLSYLFSKMALGAAEPSLLLAVRFAVTFLALNLMLLCRAGRLSLKGKPVGMAILMGVLQPALCFRPENYGVKFAAGWAAGVVASSSPALAMALGAGCVSATLAASVPLALLSRWYAVKARAPATVFLLCGIFPLVPGAGIYYTAYYFVSGQMALFSAKLAEVIKVALALSVGIAVVLSVPLPHSHVYGPKGEVKKAAPFSHFRH